MPAYRVLIVCTGNIYRSAAAEVVLRKGLVGRGIEITSAGVRGLRSAPMASLYREALGQAEPSVASHRSRLLRPEHLRDADLVLTMTREQRTTVVSMHPAALRYALTLSELARAAEQGGSALDASLPPAARLRALGSLALASRNQTPTPDVVDPISLDDDEALAVLDEIQAACASIIRAVSG